MADDERELSDDEQAALHQVELGIEWLHRAHGALIEFHHNTGHAMDHFDRAETHFREAEQTALADVLRDDHLPRGVIDDDRWSYDLIENFQAGFLSEMTEFETTARQMVADGQQHIAEREQKRRWKQRVQEEQQNETDVNK